MLVCIDKACFSVWQVIFVLEECNLSVLAKPSGCTQILSPPSAGLWSLHPITGALTAASVSTTLQSYLTPEPDQQHAGKLKDANIFFLFKCLKCAFSLWVQKKICKFSSEKLECTETCTRTKTLCGSCSRLILLLCKLCEIDHVFFISQCLSLA